MTENGARVSEPRHVTETQDMSAGIQTDFHSNVTTKLTMPEVRQP